MNQTSNKGLPEIGAEVFIEPGQTAEEIDNWFKQLRDAGMTVTRIRLFESYMHRADGSWDFSLFDIAFHAAEKYGIKVYGNLFPATVFTDVGGFKFAKSEENLREIANYIQHLVVHFKDFPALYGWVPINEPGSGLLPQNELIDATFNAWKLEEVAKAYNNSGFVTLDFAEERFLLGYNTWFLKWLTDEIHRYHPDSIIHVNNHAIFQHVAEYDFPAWREFLTSLGGSAHASWHFGYFDRQQYAVAMSANSEILRSGAGEIPWLMTELQGGNNTYSAFDPMCPTPEEIAQWLWITIGSGSRGSIFWCLNPRRSGFEAGEWAMLDFQDNPTDRMLRAAQVIGTLENNTALFAEATVASAKINVIYTRESMWVERALQIPGKTYEGRAIGGTMKSALAYFEALGEMGIHAGFKEIREFDFNRDDYSGEALILSHQISIPSTNWQALHNFVARGGHLIVDGLTGYYNERAFTLMGKAFPFEKLFGATVKEFKMVDDLFDFPIQHPQINLSATLWSASLKVLDGKPVAADGEVIKAVRNQYGEGSVLFMPALVGLAARMEGSYSNLVALIQHELQPILQDNLFMFKKHQPKMLLKVLRAGLDWITILINKNREAQNLELVSMGMKADCLYADGGGLVGVDGKIVINPEETMVLKWSASGS